jgi:hypothetical protein
MGSYLGNKKMVSRSEAGDDKYVAALEDRVKVLSEIIKLKSHAIAELERLITTSKDPEGDPATSHMALVPENPDQKMLDAAAWVLSRMSRIEETPYAEIAKKVWKAMLEASN